MREDYIGMGQAFGTSLLGIAIVFVVLAALIFMIWAISRATRQKAAPVAEAASPVAAPVTAAPAPPAQPGAGKVPAKGSLGAVDLHTVDDPTAALLMAIVADRMQAPLNQLRFISIREISEDVSR